MDMADRYIVRGFYRNEEEGERDWTRDTLSSAEGLARSVLRASSEFDLVHVYEDMGHDLLRLVSKHTA